MPAKLSRGDVTATATAYYDTEYSEPTNSRYIYVYTVKITNHSESPIIIMTRHWIIIENGGHTRYVNALGVCGNQPIVDPGDFFEITSGTVLTKPTGMLRGAYRVGIPDVPGLVDVTVPDLPLDTSLRP